jgi:hypothetical protein
LQAEQRSVLGVFSRVGTQAQLPQAGSGNLDKTMFTMFIIEFTQVCACQLAPGAFLASLAMYQT